MGCQKYQAVEPQNQKYHAGFSPEVVTLLREAAEWRKNKLASSEYDETTWAARTFNSFVSQRISVAAQLAMAQEAAEALGLSVAADPRGQ